VAYDYSKLLGRIVEKYGTQSKFSGAFGMSERSLSLKLNDHGAFKQPEITRACELLEISEADIPIYFFTLKVQSN
jgi:hypothetical protein